MSRDTCDQTLEAVDALETIRGKRAESLSGLSLDSKQSSVTANRSFSPKLSNET